MTSHAPTRDIAASAAPIAWEGPAAERLLALLDDRDDGRSLDFDGCLLVSYRADCDGSPTRVREIVAHWPERAIVVLARKAEISANDAIAIMKAGAFDLVLEPIAPRALAARLETAAEEGRRRLETHRARACARERLERLTPRERDVTEELVRGASNKLAARALEISPRTVEFYRARIFEKLEIASVAELTRVALTAA
jgi:two-component system response regulator FixJ